jgi:hypothetical protein
MGIPTKPSQNLTAQGAIVIKNIGRAQALVRYLFRCHLSLPSCWNKPITTISGRF